MKEQKHNLKWFQNRIGKRVFRNDVKCPCRTCNDVNHGGIIIKDRNHAEYLLMVQTDLDLYYYEK